MLQPKPEYRPNEYRVQPVSVSGSWRSQVLTPIGEWHTFESNSITKKEAIACCEVHAERRKAEYKHMLYVFENTHYVGAM